MIETKNITERQAVTLPSFVGRNVDEAVNDANELGLKPEAKPKPLTLGSDPLDAELGTVRMQDPPAGTVVELGTPIRLVFAEGTTVTMPDLVGEKISAAAKTAETLGLQITVKDVTLARVVAQDPPAGTEVSPSAVVTLLVAEQVASEVES